MLDVIGMPGVPAGADDTGVSRDEAAPPQLYERSDDDDGDDEEEDEEGVGRGGVSKVDPGRWAASICVKDTGCMLDVGTCVTPHRLWSRALSPCSLSASSVWKHTAMP